jgi:tRNA(Ile)-lysidine synthase
MSQPRDPLGELRRFFHVRRIRPEEGVLLAVSGGRDSMTLAKAFALWRAREPRSWRIRAASIDHGLRPEAAKEARFVRNTLALWDIRTDMVKLEPPEKFPQGPLAWAREARYAALDQLCNKHELTYVVTAHHEDDLAETVLLRLIRSAAVQPLSAMHRGQRRRLRPFLSLRREDITRFAQKHGVPFYDDPSNVDPSHPRTRVRHELIPLLNQLAGGTIVSRLSSLASDLADDEDELAARAAGIADILNDAPAVTTLKSLPRALRRRALWSWLVRMSDGAQANRAQLDGALALLDTPRGEVRLDPKRVLVREGPHLKVKRKR